MEPLRIFTDLESTVGTAAASRVVEGIAASRNLVIFCGAGVSVQCGLPDLRSPEAFWDQVVIPGTGQQRAVKGSDLLANSQGAEGVRLACLNRLMTQRRIAARKAVHSPFYVLLEKLMVAGVVRKCVTKNVDGLETDWCPRDSDKVVMVHGDNRVLTCLESCPDICGEEVIKFDDLFLNDRPVTCPSCEQKRDQRKRTNRRSLANPKTQTLRPSVRWDESLDPDFLIDELYTSFPQEIEGCDALLIIGTRPTGSAYTSIVPEIARKVHEFEGAVVFVDPSPLPTGEFKDRVDFHLQMDVQLCSKAIMQALDRNLSAKAKESAVEIWAELSEPLLPVESHLDKMPELTIPLCCQCALALEDVLATCCVCGTHYCCEIPGVQTGRMCVRLDYFPNKKTPVDFSEQLKSFRCFECHDHENGMYPHFIKRVPMFRPRPVSAPRLLLVVYYLSQFWPMAEHIITSVTSAWKTMGWEYYSIPMRLQSLDTSIEHTATCQWERRTYKALVVYVTHGTRGQQRYQFNDTLELSPAQFLDKTLQPVAKLLRNAEFSAAFLLACGHVYDSPTNVVSIEKWLKV
ncbi:hypothetical protein FRC10_000948 [Ceratobasidium sp. 414]|nr:hypothetical protein FRC10_000948 [Ceratobasidium sp. 414]